MSADQNPAVTQRVQSLVFVPAGYQELHGKISYLHLMGVESLDMHEAGEEGEFPKPAVQVNELVGDLTCYRDVTIVYEISELKDIGDLARSFQNLRFYLDIASSLYLEDEIFKLADIMHQAYQLVSSIGAGALAFNVKYTITNNVFGLRVGLTVTSTGGTACQTNIFVFNPKFF